MSWWRRSRRLRSWWAIVLVSIVAAWGCASVKYEELAEMPAPEEGKGLVVFYRENAMGGAAISYHVQEGDRIIGALRSGTYFYHHSEPGTHTYWAQTSVKKSITVEVVAGETTYVRGDVSMGIYVGHPRLRLADAKRAQAAIAKLKYAVPDT